MGDFLIGLFIPIGIVIIIFVIILLVVNTKKKTTIPSITTSITSKPATHPPPAPKKTNWLEIIGGTVGIIIGIWLILFLGSYAINWGSSFFEKKENPIKQVHTQIFEVPVTGIYKYLHPGWQAWPTKSITVVTPTGATIENTPGKPTYPGYQPEGWYHFLTEEKNCQVKAEDIY